MYYAIVLFGTVHGSFWPGFPRVQETVPLSVQRSVIYMQSMSPTRHHTLQDVGMLITSYRQYSGTSLLRTDTLGTKIIIVLISGEFLYI